MIEALRRLEEDGRRDMGIWALGSYKVDWTRASLPREWRFRCAPDDLLRDCSVIDGKYITGT